MNETFEEDPQPHRDSLRAPLTATIEVHGWAQSTAVLHPVGESGPLKGSPISDRQGLENLKRNPDGDLLIIDPVDPHRTTETRAETQPEPDSDKATVRKSGEEESVQVSPEAGRFTVTYRPWLVIASPWVSGG